MQVSLFKNGNFSGLIECPEHMLQANIPEGFTPIIGDYRNHYMLDNQLVHIPPSPSQYHHWDENKHSWELGDLQPIKEAAWERIKQYRDHLNLSGVTVGEYRFHTDTDSKLKYLALLLAPSSIPPDLQWKTMSGVFVRMTLLRLQQVFAAISTMETHNFAKAERHKSQMEQLAEPWTYDFSGGWYGTT